MGIPTIIPGFANSLNAASRTFAYKGTGVGFPFFLSLLQQRLNFPDEPS